MTTLTTLIIILLLIFLIVAFISIFETATRIENTIENFKVRKLLYKEGWERISTDNEEYYTFVKENYKIYYSLLLCCYVLVKTDEPVLIKTFSKTLTKKQVVEIIKLTK